MVAAHNCLASYIVPVIGVAFILYYALWGSKNVNTDIKID
jgi:FHS family L-fucose permease-like MFS transporter